jgi:hypothetical protein
MLSKPLHAYSTEKRLAQTKFNLQKVVKMNAAKFSLATKQLNRTDDEDDYGAEVDACSSDELPLTEQILNCITMIMKRKPKGRRYASLQKYFALVSFMGPHYYGLLHTTLLFPSYRTTLTYRNQIFEQIGATDNIFDGSLDNLKFIISKCISEDFGGKAILAIDATSVTLYVAVDINGNIEGLIRQTKTSADHAIDMIKNEESFSRFVTSNKNNFIAAVFVMMIIPLDTCHRAIPICCIPVKHGSATEDTMTYIVEILSHFEDSDIRIMGLATDGDPQYNKMSMAFMEHILEHIDRVSEHTASDVVRSFASIGHFSDPFHLVKRDRYRKVSKESFIVDPWTEGQIYSVHDLLELGIPDYLLSPEQARKMEDLLPLRLFSHNTLGLILDRDDPGLFVAMLPSTLLMESLHSKYLSRKQRIDYLLIGASLMILFELYKKIIRHPPPDMLDIRLPSIKNTAMCFTREWSSEYISLTLRIADLLCSETTLNLGSCGTHILEHYFGNIRRHSHGNNTYRRFLKAMKNVFLEQHLLKELEIPRESPQRRSDSGVKVCDPLIPDYPNMMYYFHIARGLVHTCMHIPMDTSAFKFALPKEPFTLREFAEKFLHFEEIEPKFISTKQKGFTATGGLRNYRIWSASQQLKGMTS